MKKRSLLVLSSSVAAVLALVVSRASGAALVTYDFENYTISADTGAPASTVTPPSAGVTATNLAPNAGAAGTSNGFLGRSGSGNVGGYFFTSGSAPITPSNGAGRSVGTQSLYTYADTTDTTTTTSNAVSGNTYYSFTLTPASGANFSFGSTDALTFALQVRSGTTTAGAVPYNVQFFVRTSLNNYAADLGSTTPLGVTTTLANNSANETVSLAALGTLAANQAITFRLYPVDNQQNANNDFKFDNVVVNGTVPEPGTYVLLGLGAFGLMIVRRRRAAC